MTLTANEARLCLVIAAGTAAMERLSMALEAAPIASVLILPSAEGELNERLARSLVELAQRGGAAALLLADAELAQAVGADGVHLPHGPQLAQSYAEARRRLGIGHIVGVDAGTSRHDAMTLGESGADYVAFGLSPDFPDRRQATPKRLELVDWWSELFEVPCVAFNVETVQEVRELAAAGADFVAVNLDCEPAREGRLTDWLRDLAAGIEAPAAQGQRSNAI